jgi:transcriptional regulator with XRE-family HTH domain
MKTREDKQQEIREKLGDERSASIEAIAHLVNRLYERRLDLGWTQEQLAENAVCRQEQIARIDNGRSMPRLDTVVAMAKALALRIDVGIEEAVTTLTSLPDQQRAREAAIVQNFRD